MECYRVRISEKNEMILFIRSRQILPFYSVLVILIRILIRDSVIAVYSFFAHLTIEKISQYLC